ncbi:MAG: hypothetical protein JXB14_00335 [Candidatus Altiarchaeota archaeon]|nr:hypothetical protein [Candidatus Altiarchaeota archaeon]
MVLEGFIKGWTKRPLKKTAIIILITAIVAVLMVDYSYIAAKTAQSSYSYYGYYGSSYNSNKGLSEYDFAFLALSNVLLILAQFASWLVLGASIYIAARLMGADAANSFRSILSLLGIVYIYSTAFLVVVYLIILLAAKSLGSWSFILLMFLAILYVLKVLYVLKTGIKLIYGNLDKARSWAIALIGPLLSCLLMLPMITILSLLGLMTSLLAILPIFSSTGYYL